MPVTLTMPALSPTMEEGILVRWLIAEGDVVAPGQVIAEIETDKATLDFEAPAAGTVARLILSAGGAAVAVNTPIALLATEGEDASAIVDKEGAAPDAAAAPAAETPHPQAAVSPTRPLRRIAASPLARRIAALQDVDLAKISGSGPNGRIVRRDVEEAASSAIPAAVAPAPPSQPESADESLYRPGSYDVIELDTMRRTIARRLTDSKKTVPHFYLRTDVKLDLALALREQLNAAAPRQGNIPGWKISINDMVIKALGGALLEVPEANATWAGDRILRHHKVDVAVAVALDGGLITPVIRDVGAKPLSAISNAMKDLAARARMRKLAPEEYQGGTTSLSNLGMFGVSSFDAVINPPHGTILAIGAAEKRPVVRGDTLATATMMTATFSVDHRVVDGALGARLLVAFKRQIEEPLVLIA